ncbi:MAG: OPT/YSL family transporter [Lentisphaerae bacterium]|nr:OPT/YSL family transporter [Lentisphaerota bacterium]
MAILSRQPARRADRELEEFRQLMEPPSTFEEGFNWKSMFGALFIVFLMVPGSIYMGLLAGQSIGPAAQWVTVILFIEVARRAHVQLKRAEIFVLFYMAAAAMGGPFSGLLWNQFFARSQAAASVGIADQLPAWFAPPADSASYGVRTFFHVDWLPVLGMIVFSSIFGTLSSMVLGYGLFRVTSDVERLPFPMAPIGALGVMALAEDIGEKNAANAEENWRWRVFSIGGALGLVFGLVYLGVPTITGALIAKPIIIFPLPFSDITAKTQAILPAVATGLSWDMSLLIIGMVFPFFTIIGSFIGMLITVIANPILYHHHILRSWTSGDNTVVTLFKNNVDFYFSFTVGVSLAIAAVGLYQVIVSVRRARAKARLETGAVPGVTLARRERGDIRPFWIVTVYLLMTISYIVVSGMLINWHRGVMLVLLFFGFVYTPLISYVTARLEGIAGQIVEIPMIREASLILSGYQGVTVWFLPIPMANYGQMTSFYRQCELTGTKFTSIWKTQVLLFPLILIGSFFFMNFIWKFGEVPSATYPYAQTMWDLQAANQCIMYSATLGEYSIFEEAFNWRFIAAGLGFGTVLFSALSIFGAPIFLVYGVLRGLGQTMPHSIIPELIGALLGRFYFQKRLGLKWRQYIPVVAAGFACGMGLISMLSIGFTFMSKAVIELPY